MDWQIFLLFIMQGGIFFYVFVMLQRVRDHEVIKHNDERRQIHDLFSQYTNTTAVTSEKFMEKMAEIQTSHFEQLEKQSGKQLIILEKQTKDFMGVMSDFIAATRASQPLVPDTSLLDKFLETENSIEKEEIPEQNLEDMSRIPIVSGINVQFDGEEEIHPINID